MTHQWCDDDGDGNCGGDDDGDCGGDDDDEGDEDNVW